MVYQFMKLEDCCYCFFLFLCIPASSLEFFFPFHVCSRESVHRKGICAMYDICGAREDGKQLNCPKNAPAVKVLVFVFSSYACSRALTISL
jgi:hypothetical protein